MNYNDFTETVKDAEQTLRYADSVVNKTLPLMVGRLRTARDWEAIEALGELKKELSNYNVKTGIWKQ